MTAIQKSKLPFWYNLFKKPSYEWWWQFSNYSNIKMKYQYCSHIPFIMLWTDIARFLQYFRNLSNSCRNIFAILQDFNGIFSKYSFNITVLCGVILPCMCTYAIKSSAIWLPLRGRQNRAFSSQFRIKYAMYLAELGAQNYFGN